MITKEKLIFTPSDTTNSDSVGAYLRGADGSLATNTTVGAKVAVDVNLADGGAANIAYAAVSLSISTTQTQVKVGASNLAGRKSVIMYNSGLNTVYFGPSGVTTSTGIPILSKQMISLNAGDANNIYLITSTSTSTVVVQELS